MRYFIVLVTLAAVIAVRPADSAACKCAQPSLREAVEGADAVFIGTVVAVRRRGDDHQITVKVTAVWRGKVAATTVVRSSASSCGIATGGAKKGRSFLFVARQRDGVYRARQCDGSQRATAKVRAALIELLGEPSVP